MAANRKGVGDTLDSKDFDAEFEKFMNEASNTTYFAFYYLPDKKIFMNQEHACVVTHKITRLSASCLFIWLRPSPVFDLVISSEKFHFILQSLSTCSEPPLDILFTMNLPSN